MRTSSDSLFSAPIVFYRTAAVMMIICCSVVVPLLLAVGAAGSRPSPSVNDTQLAAEVITNVGKMFDDPDEGPSLIFNQFIEALQLYTEQVVNDAVNLALMRLAPFIGMDVDDSEEFSSESSHVNPPPMSSPSLDHHLQFLDRQRNVALQNYMEALDQYREIQPKILHAEDLDDEAWLENEKAKIDFYEIRDNYLRKGVTNLLEKEDYKKSLLKWNSTHKQQLKALEWLIDVRSVFMDAREQYMHAKERQTLAQQRYMETLERYPRIQDYYPQIYDRLPQQEVKSVKHELVAEQSSRKKNVDSSKEHSKLDEAKDNHPDHFRQLFNSDKVSTPLPRDSPAALSSNVEYLSPVEGELTRGAIKANAHPNKEDMSGNSKLRRRRSSGWDTLGSLNPLNVNFSFFYDILSGDFSILDSLFEDSPQVIYCPATGTKLIRCVRDQWFHGVVKTHIDSLGSWFSDFFVPDFYL